MKLYSIPTLVSATLVIASNAATAVAQPPPTTETESTDTDTPEDPAATGTTSDEPDLVGANESSTATDEVSSESDESTSEQTSPKADNGNDTPSKTTEHSASAEKTIVATPEDIPTADPTSGDQKFTILAYSDTVWHTDRSFDLFADNDTSARLGLSFGMDVLKFGESLSLEVALGYANEHLDGGEPIGDFVTGAELSAHHLSLAPALKLEVFPWLTPHVRALGGVSFVNTSISYSPRGIQEDDSISPMFGGGAGAMSTFHAKGGGLKVGLLVEGGYVVGAPLEIAMADEPAATKPNEGRRIEGLGVKLGEVPRSGPFLRIAAALRF